jgi:hypothetical protein
MIMFRSKPERRWTQKPLKVFSLATIMMTDTGSSTKRNANSFNHEMSYLERKRLSTRKVIISENHSTSKQEIQADRDELTDDDEEEQETEDTSISGTSESDCEHNADKTTRCLRDRSTLKTPEKLQNSVMHFATSPEEPEIYGEATKLDQKDHRKEAMNREINALQESQT